MPKRSKENTLKKPQNSFFLYRRLMKDRIQALYGTVKSHEISKIAGECWAKEPIAVKSYFARLSLAAHNQFKETFPDYDWQPWKRNGIKKSTSNSSLKSQLSSSLDEIIASGSLIPDKNPLYGSALTIPDVFQFSPTADSIPEVYSASSPTLTQLSFHPVDSPTSNFSSVESIVSDDVLLATSIEPVNIQNIDQFLDSLKYNPKYTVDPIDEFLSNGL
ncbi:hypothetical protein HDV01_007506 [Terramyces sp. JEL0728]|nr:hypothetical protein HDV01_007506 [Terramyces sp. JEL0728]